MINRIAELLSERGITLAAPISLKNCIISRGYKLQRAGFSETDDLTAIIFAIPYLTRTDKRNLSAYAVSRDYHAFANELFSSVIGQLSKEFPNHKFAGFADDSPIFERDAAARAGLGVIGKNGMLITEKFSSYVFLGEIITDIPYSGDPLPVEYCCDCGACHSACPMQEIGSCLSALTQKKGELCESERAAIKKHGSAWGCDICQEVCPHTKRAIANGTIYTDIDFFKKDAIAYLTSEALSNMSDEDFSKRAYSWRGRKTIGRNLEILESPVAED